MREIVLREEPLCRKCLEEGRIEVTVDVDHIQPLRGKDDPLRLVRSNLRGLCKACHSRITAAQVAAGLV